MGRLIQNAQQFEQIVAQEMARLEMLPFGARVGVAVSGGADSVALLLVLDALRTSHRWDLCVLHLNHGLRGPCSDDEETFVRRLAERLAIPIVVRGLFAGNAPSKGVEDWARKERMAFFRWAMVDASLERIATGHHRGDQAETVLFRLLRGAGSRGLGGILPTTDRGLVRPLLSLSRDEIRTYLLWRNQEWKEDISNSDQRYSRNAVRHHWLPELSRAWNPSLEVVLSNTAEQLRDESALLGSLALEAASRIFRSGPFGWEGRSTEFSTLPVALQRRVILNFQTASLGFRRANSEDDDDELWFPAIAVGFESIESIRAIWTGLRRNGRYTAKGLLFERSVGQIRVAEADVVAREDLVAKGASQQELQIVAAKDGRYLLTGSSRLAELMYVAGSQPDSRLASEKSGYTKGWSLLESNQLCFPLVLRRWREGDVFHRTGCASKHKIKQLFQRNGVPRWRRSDEMMLESAGEIVWSSSFGPAAGYAATSDNLGCLAVRAVPSEKEWESSLANSTS